MENTVSLLLYYPILHSDKDQQILFVGGPNTRKTNPRWRTAAVLKNRITAISPQLFHRSARNLACWRILALRTGLAVKISNVLKFKMADGRHLKLKAVNSEYLSNCRPVAGKYGMMTTLPQWTIDREFVTSAKNSRILTNFPKLKKFVQIRTKFINCPSGRGLPVG